MGDPRPETPALRQWFSFPPAAGRIKTSRLRSFHVLIETAAGRILFLAVKSKSAPDQGIAESIVNLLGERDPSLAPLQASACWLDDLGLLSRIVNESIDVDKVWLSAPILAEVFLDATLEKLGRGEQLAETGRMELEAQCRQSLADGINGFLSKLDGKIVETARACEGGQIRPSTYNYLRGSGLPDCMARRNRLQAASIFPFVLPLLPIESWLEPIRGAIDEGKPPLVDVLATLFTVPKSVIRALRHQPGGSLGPEWALRPEVLTKVLADVPEHLRPKTPAAWESFNATVSLINRISGRPVHATVNRLWLRAAALQGYKVADAADVELERAACDIDEFIGRLTDALLFRMTSEQGVNNPMAVATAVRALITAHNPARLVRIARRWRESYIREQADFSAERQLWLGACWPAILAKPFETEKRLVVGLTTAAELVAEGRTMHNCVASYAGSCLQGGSQIWSIRSLGGESCSTLETSIPERSRKLQIIQHTGLNNGTPSPDCRLAADLLVNHLNRRETDLVTYARWKKDIVGRSIDERTLIALQRPVLASLEAILPKAWSLERLLSMAKSACPKNSPARQCASVPAA